MDKLVVDGEAVVEAAAEGKVVAVADAADNAAWTKYCGSSEYQWM